MFRQITNWQLLPWKWYASSPINRFEILRGGPSDPRGRGGSYQKNKTRQTSKKKNHAKVRPLRKMLALAIKKSYSPKATKKEILHKKLPTPLPGDLMVRPSVVGRGGSTNSVVWTLLNTNFINSVTQTKVYMNTHVVTRFNSDNNSIFL